MENQSGWTLAQSERGSALVVVLVAIVILLPLTLLLSTVALRWQKQSLSLRDGFGGEFAARAGLEEAKNRIATDGFDLAPERETSFVVDEIGPLTVSVSVLRQPDIVLTVSGQVLEGAAARSVDVEATGTDAEGREVYRYRPLEVYMVRSEVIAGSGRRGVRLYSVIGRLPDGSIRPLGVSAKKGYFDQEARK